MTVHRETPPAAAKEDPSLARLRMRETALRQKAQQLQARAEHLERVGRRHLERYARRVDAHEKIILGALVKKAGLDICRVDDVAASKQPSNGVVLSSIASKDEDKDGVPVSTPSNQLPNDAVLASFDCRVADSSASYDRELILGGLLWLASVLHGAPGEAATVPSYDGLREAGRLAGANVSGKKAVRIGA